MSTTDEIINLSFLPQIHIYYPLNQLFLPDIPQDLTDICLTNIKQMSLSEATWPHACRVRNHELPDCQICLKHDK